jgi:hypothetical protein
MKSPESARGNGDCGAKPITVTLIQELSTADLLFLEDMPYLQSAVQRAAGL